MSFLLIERENHKNWTDIRDHFRSISFDASDVILPYSTRSENFIYSGNEKIPFNQRNADFQLIMRKEFKKAMQEHLKKFS
jgi:hypothetical protein